jgi:hypothetical protein
VVLRGTRVGESLTWTDGRRRSAIRSRRRRAAFLPISWPAWSTLVSEMGPSAGYSIALAVVLTIIVAVVSTGQYVVLSRNERAAS